MGRKESLQCGQNVAGEPTEKICNQNGDGDDDDDDDDGHNRPGD
jgi:hypothetical protein